MGRTFGRVMAANFSCLVGALGGIKAADMVGWDGNKYEAMKERLRTMQSNQIVIVKICHSKCVLGTEICSRKILQLDIYL